MYNFLRLNVLINIILESINYFPTFVRFELKLCLPYKSVQL